MINPSLPRRLTSISPCVRLWTILLSWCSQSFWSVCVAVMRSSPFQKPNCIDLQKRLRRDVLPPPCEWFLPRVNKRNPRHRSVGRCDGSSRPEHYPKNTRTEYPHRMSGLAGCRVFRAESPLHCAVPTRDTRILRKLQGADFLRSRGRGQNEANALRKSNRISYAIDHEY